MGTSKKTEAKTKAAVKALKPKKDDKKAKNAANVKGGRAYY